MDFRTRTTIALSTSVLALSLLQLKAMADPAGIFQPAKCGPNATYGLAQVDASTNPVIFARERKGKGQILATTVAANNSQVERRAGYEVSLKGLRNLNVPGSGPWDQTRITYKFPQRAANKANAITTDDIVVHFHFKKAGRVVKTFRELGEKSLERDRWSTVAIGPSNGFGNNDLLTRVVVYVRNSENETLAADFGDIQIIHKNQGGIEQGFLSLFKGDCNDLDVDNDNDD